MSLHQYRNNPSTTLSGSVTAGATSISVSSATPFPSRGKFTVIVDSEIMLVTGVTGTTWTVERGHEATTAASHNNNATVTQILTVDSFLNSGHLDIRYFGAVGDGSTDDTSAIQAAINAAIVSGTPVFVPTGTWIIDSLSTSAGVGAQPLTIRGAGFGSILKLKAGTTAGNMIFVNPSTVSGLTVENLMIDGNKANVSGNGRYGIRVHTDNVTVRGVYFRDTIQEGIYHSAGSGGLNSRMIVSDCIFHGCGRYGIAAEFISGITITGCTAEDCGAGLVDVEPSANGDVATDITITGNTVKNTGTAVVTAGAIQVYGVNGVAAFATQRGTISGNVIDVCGGSGIQVGNASSIAIVGNVVYGAKRWGISAIDGGGTLTSIALTITGNIVRDSSGELTNTYSGIFLERALSCIVSNNVLSGTTHKYHVEVTADSTANVIGMNNYRDTAGTGQQLANAVNNLVTASYNS